MDSTVTPLPRTIRAWVATGYGGPEVLALRDVPLPLPGKGEVLIRVQATTGCSGVWRWGCGDLVARSSGRN
jgi:D-arabinose 1-dehydrogenase-like Zn-dependent alcohol dehydrogenase